MEMRVAALEQDKADRSKVEQLRTDMMTEFANLRAEMNAGFAAINLQLEAINRTLAILIARTEPPTDSRGVRRVGT